MSLFIVIIYNTIRDGLEFQGKESLIALGFAWSLFNLPIFLSEIEFYKKKIRSRILQDEFLLTFILLLLTFLLGLTHAKIGYVLSVIGVISFLRNLFVFMKSVSWYDGISIAFVLLISIWISMKVWEGSYLHPMLLEIMPFDNKFHLDTWFHVSITQMIKTYHVPSTGLNGIPFMNYHFGSHILFASLSNALDIHVFTFYQLVFPVVFIPLFLKVVLALPITWAERNNQEYKIRFWFWLVLTFGLFGIFYNGVLTNASATTSTFIVGESYCISLILFFLTLHLLVKHIDLKEESQESRIVTLVFIPLLTIILGISKISTLFILDVILFFLMVRLKLYRTKSVQISFALVTLLSLGCFYITMDPYSTSQLEPFHFFKTFVKLNPVAFGLVYYFWSILLVIILIFIIRFEVEDANKLFPRVLLETVLIVCIVGFIPGAVLTIHGGSANYFMDIHFWFSISCMLIILPRIINLVKTFLATQSQRQRILMLGAAILIFLCFVSYRNFRYQRINFLMNTYAAYSRMAGKEVVLDTTGNPIKNRVSMSEIIQHQKELRVQIDSNLSVNPDYHALRKLFLMDTLSTHEKSKMALVLDDVGILSRKYPCNIFPFMVPALSGMTFKNGYVFENCVDYNYYFQYYSNENLRNYSFEFAGIAKELKVNLKE